MSLAALAFKETAAAAYMRALAHEIDARTFDVVMRKDNAQKPQVIRLSSLTYVHDVFVAQRPENTGQTYAEFFSCPTPHGECLVVVKPGHQITSRFSPTNNPMTESEIRAALVDVYRERQPYIPAAMRQAQYSSRARGVLIEKGSRYARETSVRPASTFSSAVSSNITYHRPFEQFTREKLAELFFSDFGLGHTHAPILPILGQHPNFLLAGSVVLGAGKSDLMFEGQHDQKWFANDWDAHNHFVSILIDHPKLWSLICANLPARAVLGDKNYNLGAHVLMEDREGKIAPYSCDVGKAFDEMDAGVLCEAINSSEIIEKCTNAKLAKERGAPARADMQVMLEVVHNIYQLSPEAIRRNVEAVREMVPSFVIEGKRVPYFIIEKERTVAEVCEAFEESRRELAPRLNAWSERMNHVTGLKLFDPIPAMPG